MTKRKHYDGAFKREAVRLLEKGEKPAAQLAYDLGIRRNQLYKWKEDLARRGERASRGSGRPPVAEESEVTRLRRELERVEAERDILKKAAAYFARQLP